MFYRISWRIRIIILTIPKWTLGGIGNHSGIRCRASGRYNTIQYREETTTKQQAIEDNISNPKKEGRSHLRLPIEEGLQKLHEGKGRDDKPHLQEVNWQTKTGFSQYLLGYQRRSQSCIRSKRRL